MSVTSDGVASGERKAGKPPACTAREAARRFAASGCSVVSRFTARVSTLTCLRRDASPRCTIASGLRARDEIFEFPRHLS